jgi:hypothetical protein
MPDDLDELFPNLAPILKGWGSSSSGSLPTDEHGGVTDEAVAEYVRQRMSSGQPVGPNPLIDGQSGRPPQFQTGVSGVAPKDSYVEPDAGSGGGIPAPIPAPADTDVPPEEPPPDETPLVDIPPAPPPVPDDTPPPPPAEDVVVGDQRIPRSRIEQYAQLDARMRDDPRWARFVTDYLATGQVPVERVQVPQAPPVPPAPQYAPLPPLPAEYADDPVTSQLHAGLNAALVDLRARQEQITQAIMAQQQVQFATAQSQNDALVMRASRDFMERKGLTPEEMKRLEQVTADLNILPSFLRGRHPVYGTPFKGDPIAAVDAALDVAYNAIPEYRAKEEAKVQAQRRADHAKRQKLAGVSGSSGSVPRMQPAPTTEAGRRQAMVSEVGAMMNGEWSEPN